jgi:hypothetical protein
MSNNRTTGVVFLVVGIGWLATLPAFQGWMVSMEGSAGPDRPDEAAWRMWRALEILLVEPRWLAYVETLGRRNGPRLRPYPG